ncbi:MAG: ECF transporter S component [Candidatus Korarchaeota archaeon]|nr:ECF transporter S component [Thermoproteota archaeon]MCR8471867.1 ECF transporter S component [Thermoproteota archaeon]MCR8488252.1 ECF transporter S component [Thermoproteota archaeon]
MSYQEWLSCEKQLIQLTLLNLYIGSNLYNKPLQCPSDFKTRIDFVGVFMLAESREIKLIALAAILAAVVFVFTIVVAISIPATGGFWNVGEAGVYLAAIIGGPIVGALAGGIGSALADLYLGYPIYAPGTLIIKAAEGFVAGFLYLTLVRGKESIKRKYALLISIVAILGVTLASYLYTYFHLGMDKITIELTSEPLSLTFSTEIQIWILLAFVITVEIIALLLLFLGRRAHIMIFSCLIAGILMVYGYYLYETMLLGSEVALVEVIPNMFQSIVGIAISVPIIHKLEEMGVIDRIKEFMGSISK